MSIDLIAGERHTPTRAWNRAAVESAVHGIVRRSAVDLVLVFGGWGQSEGGAVMGQGDDTGSGRLAKKLKSLRSASGNTVIVRAWQGQLRAYQRESDDFVRDQFHPLGKLIICGYSAGGFNAMSLASSLHTTGYYNVNRHSWLSYYHHSASAGGDVMGIARVDLLVTVDAAQGPTTGLNSRAVPPSVRKNLNIYQQHASRVGSHGGANAAVDTSATLVENRDWSSRYTSEPIEGHATIDEDSLEAVAAAVREELSR